MKKINRQMVGIFGLLFIALFTMGAKIGGPGNNTLRIGDKTGVDVEIKMGEGRLKWDSATNKMQFSNDSGSSVKEIGSGGGGAGGVSILENADFESGSPPADWTASGGTFIAETSTPGFDLVSGSWDSNGMSQTLDSTLVAVPEGLENRSCNATIQYKAAAGEYDLVARANTAGELARISLAATTDWSKAAIQFTCPSSDSMSIRIESTVADAVIILLDNATLGKTDFVDISQATILVHAEYVAAANCTWVLTSTSLASFPTDSDCPSITVHNSTTPINTADNDLPDIIFQDNQPPGLYKVTISGTLGRGVNGQKQVLAIREINSGVIRGKISDEEDSTGWRVNVTLIGVFTHSTSGPLAFEVVGAADGSTIQLINNTGANDAQNVQTIFTVERFPLASAEAITLETVAQSWKGFHDDTCSWARTNVVLGDPVADASCVLVEEINSAFGTVIKNSGDFPGISFTPKSNGKYFIQAVATFTLAGGHLFAQLNDGSSIIGECYTTKAAANAQSCVMSGIYDPTSLSQVDLKIQWATDTGSATLAEGAALTSQTTKSIEWNIFRIDQQFPTPVFTALTTSLDSKVQGSTSSVIKTRFATCEQTGTHTCSEPAGQNWISSIADSGVGSSDLILNADFSTLLGCNISIDQDGVGGANGSCHFDPISNTAIDVDCFDLGTPSSIDRQFFIECKGF